ncbi:hypothetical protein AAP_01118 [Ascosphaera apis ARSEF 7405]|uniref:Uncharacterized protein n=1 Tax=Ascosphaera apis ARSEF 7405 TaxID=392613 RepID=A0A168CA78_9EURO|nr:hypothetical protein AAP_01118 [Ascosphaera apis ARSEF 7405]
MTQDLEDLPANTQEGKLRSYKAALESFAKVVRYCEATDRCRHEIISEFSGDKDLLREKKALEKRKREQERKKRDASPPLTASVEIDPGPSQRQRPTSSSSGDLGPESQDTDTTDTEPLCDYACDYCKFGASPLLRAKKKMIESMNGYGEEDGWEYSDIMDPMTKEGSGDDSSDDIDENHNDDNDPVATVSDHLDGKMSKHVRWRKSKSNLYTTVDIAQFELNEEN